MLLPFTSRLPPSCGVKSLTTSANAPEISLNFAQLILSVLIIKIPSPITIHPVESLTDPASTKVKFPALTSLDGLPS